MTGIQPTILHVIDTTGPGGAETIFLNLAAAIQVEGHAPLAMIQGPGWVQTQLEKLQIPFVILAPTGFLSMPYYWAVFKLLKHHNVKLVQAHLLGSALTFAILNRLTGIPVVATLHGQVDVHLNERFMVVKHWLLKKGLEKVVSVSDHLADNLADRKLFNREKIVVIHNGIEVEKYKVANTGRLKKALNLPDQAKLVGSIGNIRPAKDYPNLIRAAVLVLKENKDIHFLIAGHAKEPLQSELTSLAVDLGIQNNIHFLGFLDDTAEFLAQLDVFALTSVSEGFSIATLEAMAAKVPIIVTRCGGPEEILRHQVDGLIVERGCPWQLSNGISRLVANSNCDFTANAYAKVSGKFNIQTLVLSYRALVTDILHETRATKLS
ncbi:glycosyltransferase [Reinekea sp.]|jgi:glycosyltransferase involved in cell wall biosynthesis|uniref:glycosyltransferase n=1 Tax=Reinekea sp. TaxID=1970455 RepID=UPI002A83C4B1|nr:glycosyltransferase [Reinekea sp.]